MVIVKMQGGLGNQMFQYAAARGVSSTKVLFDLSIFSLCQADNDQYTVRTFELDIFSNLVGTRLSTWQHLLFNSKNPLIQFLRRSWYGKMSVIKEQGSGLVQLPNRNLVLNGFFQNEKYFNEIRKDLIHEFEFPLLDIQNQKIANKIESEKNSVSVHVRRGDYLKPKVRDYHGIIPLKYYSESLAIIKQEVRDASFFIFSDDPDWCEMNLTSNLGKFTIVKGNVGKDAWKDMFLMSQCKHHIIANSTFSWWGAWLSNNPDKKVIAPKTWFLDDKMNAQTSQLIPEAWRRV